MTTLEAHELFARRALRGDRSICPDVAATFNGQDVWPALMVAYVTLAGCLDDARTDADLDDGVKHFLSLESMGLVEALDVEYEALKVVADLMNWGERQKVDGQPPQPGQRGGRGKLPPFACVNPEAN